MRTEYPGKALIRHRTERCLRNTGAAVDNPWFRFEIGLRRNGNGEIVAAGQVHVDKPRFGIGIKIFIIHRHDISGLFEDQDLDVCPGNDLSGWPSTWEVG
jgi:hypothetical protein